MPVRFVLSSKIFKHSVLHLPHLNIHNDILNLPPCTEARLPVSELSINTFSMVLIRIEGICWELGGGGCHLVLTINS